MGRRRKRRRRRGNKKSCERNVILRSTAEGVLRSLIGWEHDNKVDTRIFGGVLVDIGIVSTHSPWGGIFYGANTGDLYERIAGAFLSGVAFLWGQHWH